MKILWLEQARGDLRDIRNFIAKRNPNAAKELAAHIRRARDQIKAHPEMQSEGDIPGTRELVVRKFSCVLVYRLTSSHAEIVWVFGPGQDRVEGARRDPR
ncbi:MAG: type II toxin-antitoxin system RelE/ParE family toxin [Geminicoccaceae bacterium]